ncbi:MAG: 3-hydroxybutyryl-CoA dehydrogenase, partial [Deltaproteobacteria bacterium]
PEIKLQIFRDLDAAVKKGAILSTNTSSISITKIAAVTSRPELVIGMHFMNPVPVMKLVEIINGLQTSEDTYAIIEETTKKLSKVPVKAFDSPGFVANRILLPMINEAVYCLYEGVASAADIDNVMKLGMAHPMGPLALADLIGLDVCLSIMEVLHDGFADSKYRPCPLLRQMVEAGYLGQKTGKGFFDYK